MGASSGLVGLGLSAFGLGMNMSAQKQQLAAQRQYAKYQAAQMTAQADFAGLQADNLRELGGLAHSDTLREYNRIRGQQAAAYGASGVMVGAGTAAATVADTMAEGTYEAQKAKYAYDLQAWEKDNEKRNLLLSAEITRSTGMMNYSSGVGSIFSGALTGAVGLYSQYDNYMNLTTRRYT